jgi:hypothetical protein
MEAVVDNKTSAPLELSRAVARIHAGVLALVCALLGGGGLFLMTVWLLIKGGPNVGLHLNLLGNYFYGYSVTWLGSIVGLVWGTVVGGLVGWTIGQVYNLVVWVRQWGSQARAE